VNILAVEYSAGFMSPTLHSLILHSNSGLLLQNI
jgi:hypothetical protein